MAVILITGATRGIGYATAEYLGMLGDTVYAGYRGPKPSQDLVELSGRRLNIKTIPLDVTCDDSIQRAVEQIFREQQAVDVVVHNAGYGIYGPTQWHTRKEYLDMCNTNVAGPIVINQSVIPLMQRKGRGKIIYIGSMAGARPSANLPGYSSTKTSQAFIAAAEAAELASKGIAVSIVQAGPVVTDFKSSTRVGGRFSQIKDTEEGRDILAREGLWGQMMDSGQSAYVVAATVYEIIKSKAPPLWIQTSPKVTAMIAAHFKDTTGKGQIPIIPKL